jgi:DNA-binding MarR family transcriptional regulator
MLDVNASELYLLGRRLMKLGEEAIPPSWLDDAIVTSVRPVMVDVIAHPGSSVSEITRRTGFPQSHISQSVARLRDLGFAVTAPDATDRRRTLVWAAEGIAESGARHAAVPIDETIAKAIGAEAEDRLPEALAALELLGQLIAPDLHRLAQETACPGAQGGVEVGL